MFSHVTYYLSRHVFKAILLSELLLVGLAAVIKWVEQLKNLSVGQFDLQTIALYVLFSLPKESVAIFPMAALIGAIVGLGQLATTNELIGMQVLGYARITLIRSVLLVSVPLALLHMVVDEYVAPPLKRQADQIRMRALSDGQLTFSMYGVWAKSANEYVHIGRVHHDGRLFNVTIYDLKTNGELAEIRSAQSARFNETHWQLEKIKRLRFISNRLIQSTHEPQAVWESNLTPAQLGIVAIDPDELSISGLYDYIAYRDENQQDTSHYQLEFWRKISAPVVVMVMLLWACSYVFSSSRQVSVGTQLLIGILVGFTFYMVNQLLGSLSLVYNMPPLLACLLPSFLLGLSALLRLHSHRY